MKRFLLIIIFLLSSCQGIKDAGKVLRNEKIRTTDEFLIEKRDDLVLPPDYNELPTPNSQSTKKIEDDEKIKDLFKVKEEDKTIKKPNTTEKSILDKIRK